MTTLTLTTPLGDHTLTRDLFATIVAYRTNDHTCDHALTTGGCGHKKSRFSGAFTPLTTLTTPNNRNNGKSGKNGVIRNTAEKLGKWVWSVVTPYPSSAAASVVRTQSGPRSSSARLVSGVTSVVCRTKTTPGVSDLRPDRPFTPPLPGTPGMSGGRHDQIFATTDFLGDRSVVGVASIASHQVQGLGFGSSFVLTQNDARSGVGDGEGGHLSVSVASDVLSIPKTYSRQQGSADFSQTEHFYARAA